MPLISNVVSLSDHTTADEDASSLNGGNSNTRRATLRLKRGIEISFEVDVNGQPVPAVEPSAQSATSPAAPSRLSNKLYLISISLMTFYHGSKRARVDDGDSQDDVDLSELDAEGTADLLSRVQKDIRTLRFMAKQKEKEWNYILKLMKMKEEVQARLMRRREVLRITASRKPASMNLPQQFSADSNNGSTPAVNVVAPRQTVPTITSAVGSPNLQTLINQSLSAIMTGKNTAKSNNNAATTLSAMNMQLQQQTPQQLLQQQKGSRQRPILPKPIQGSSELQIWNANALAESALALDSQQDNRSRQGTISVQSLIADYRAKHPEEIPTRGRRVRQPSKITGEQPVSNSPPPPQAAVVDAANMSFKVYT